MSDKLTFTAKVAAEVSGIPHNTLNTLMARGDLFLGDAPGAGRARRYSFAHIAALVLMRELLDTYEMRPDLAGEITGACLEGIEKLVANEGSRQRFLLVASEPDALSYRFAYSLSGLTSQLSRWENSEASCLFVVGLHKVIARALAALTKAGYLSSSPEAN